MWHDHDLLTKWGERKKRATWNLVYFYEQASFIFVKYFYGGTIFCYTGSAHPLRNFNWNVSIIFFSFELLLLCILSKNQPTSEARLSYVTDFILMLIWIGLAILIYSYIKRKWHQILMKCSSDVWFI